MREIVNEAEEQLLLYVPSNEIVQLLLIGDLNINLEGTENHTYKLLQKLCKEVGVKVESPGSHTREGVRLDYIICGKNIRIRNREVIKKTPSDHTAIRWKIEIELPEK